jgi:transposase-like protein
MDLIETGRRFNDEATCIQYLEEVRWNGQPCCPYCESTRSGVKSKSFRHTCLTCRRSYSVLVGTIFQSTKLPLQKWFMAMNLMVNAKKGLSSLQMSRDLGVNKNTAWYLQKRIRMAMNEDDSILQGLVEADEAYVGGSMTNYHEYRKPVTGKQRGGMEHMNTVLGMVERDGHIVVKVIGKAHGKEMRPILTKHIHKESTLVTDGFGGYSGLSKHFNRHVILNRSRKIRVLAQYHTNTIEGFWSMLKRAVVGQYHKLTSEHLQSYLDEIAFKYNHRKSTNTFEYLVNRCLSPPSATF